MIVIMSAEYNKNENSTESRRIIILVFSSAVIITGICIGLIIYYHLIVSDTTTADLVGSIGGITIGTVVAILLYKVQDRDQRRMSKMVDEIAEVNQRLEDIRLSSIQGHLLPIIAIFKKLEKYGKLSDSEITYLLKRVQEYADSVKANIDYYDYYDILNVKEHFDRKEFDKALRIMRIIKNRIFSVLDIQPRSDLFKKVKDCLTTPSNKDWIIIHGKEATDDKDSVEREFLKNNLKNNFKIMDDEGAIKDKSKIKNRNLILIGGTSVNALTKIVNYKLPIQYVPFVDEKEHGLCSLISYEIYAGYEYYTVQAIPNYLDSGNEYIIVVAFGLDADGTKEAIKKLKSIIKKEDNLENKMNHDITARIWSKKAGVITSD